MWWVNHVTHGGVRRSDERGGGSKAMEEGVEIVVCSRIDYGKEGLE